MRSVATWRDLVDEPADDRHIVQLYRDPAFVQRAVGAWVAKSLSQGGAAVLACLPENADRVRAELRTLGIDPEPLERAGRFVVKDADALMARFMVDGMPDGAAFKAIAREVIRDARAACGRPDAPVRAWGEMVNLLWKRGNLPAAKALEGLWNEVIAAERIHLLCSYQADNLAPETHGGLLHDLCAGHTQLIPEEDYGRFEAAVTRALADVFGPDDASAVRTLFASRRSVPIGMPTAQAVVVGLHDLQPQLGERLLRSARSHLSRMPRD